MKKKKKTWTPIDLWANGEAAGRQHVWTLDGEDDVLCYACAMKSNVEDEEPEYRPIMPFQPNWDDEELYCCDCSTRIKMRGEEEEDNE